MKDVLSRAVALLCALVLAFAFTAGIHHFAPAEVTQTGLAWLYVALVVVFFILLKPGRGGRPTVSTRQPETRFKQPKLSDPPVWASRTTTRPVKKATDETGG